MDSKTSHFWPSMPETDEREAVRKNLVERVRRFVLENGESDERVPGLHLSYVQTPDKVPNCFHVLSVGIILQG